MDLSVDPDGGLNRRPPAGCSFDGAAFRRGLLELFGKVEVQSEGIATGSARPLRAVGNMLLGRVRPGLVAPVEIARPKLHCCETLCSTG